MENLNGFIKIHRKLLKWEWYSNLNVRILFFHCLLKANHKSEKWQGIKINAGQFVTSFGHLAKESGLSVQQTRTALDKLKLTGEITNKTTSRYTIITIKNWNLYQANNKQDNKQITNEQQTNNNKQEDKEVEEVKKNLSLYTRARVGKRERDILISFCKRNKIKNKNAYIRKVIDNGDWVEILKEEEQHQCNTRKKLEELKKFEVKIPEKINESPEVTERAFERFKQNFEKIRRGK